MQPRFTLILGTLGLAAALVAAPIGVQNNIASFHEKSAFATPGNGEGHGKGHGKGHDTGHDKGKGGGQARGHGNTGTINGVANGYSGDNSSNGRVTRVWPVAMMVLH